MAETLVLDAVEVAQARTEFDITAYVAEAGPDWGEATIEQYLADVQQGQLPVDYRLPNRTITIPLLLRGVTSGLTFEQVRARLQQKAALFQRQGGWIKRQTAIGPLYADVVGATLKFGGSTGQALWGIDADAVLTLITLPDWYGTEQTIATQTSAAGKAELVMALTGIAGDFPARVRMIVSEVDGKTIRGLFWGVRNHYYSAASTARLAYEAEALTPISPAVLGSAGGASTVKLVGANIAQTKWTSIVSTDVAGVGPMTHTGSYRVWARIYTGVYASGAQPQLRFVWDVGDLVLPVENTAVIVPSTTNTSLLVDLGEVRLDAVPVGTYRWRGVIQAKGGSSLNDVNIDKFWLQPIDEYSGKIVANVAPTVGLTNYAVRDTFLQSPGALTGKSLGLGGTWTFASGDTDDFAVISTGLVQRTVSADTAARLIFAGTATLTDTVIESDFYLAQPSSSSYVNDASFLLRYVDASNYAVVRVTGGNVAVTTVVAGSASQLTFDFLGSINYSYAKKLTLRAMVQANGNVSVWLYPSDTPTPVNPTLSATATVLATGGALASGKVGIGHYTTSPTALTAEFYSVLAWAPDVDAILFPNRSAELRYDGMYREAIGGTNYGAISLSIGDLPRLPPSGLENRTSEVLLKPSEGDLDLAADTSVSRISAQVKYRPCYLFVPEA